jgi:hypothetical protein
MFVNGQVPTLHCGGASLGHGELYQKKKVSAVGPSDSHDIRGKKQVNAGVGARFQLSHWQGHPYPRLSRLPLPVFPELKHVCVEGCYPSERPK